MKKLLIILLSFIMCVSPLVACGDSTQETTAPVETTTEYDYTKIPDVIEPHEDKVVTADELGYKAAVATTEKYWVARAKVAKNGDVTVTSLNPGTTVITVKNSYAEKIEMTVTVGLDYSIESIVFDKFEMPENYVYATDYGMSPSVSDNAPKLQAAFDAVSAMGGGTVYVPKGIYVASTVVIREGVTLRLEGVIADYNAPLSSADASNINYAAGPFAVLRANGKDMFINHKPQERGVNGCDNFAFYGGVLDMNGKNRAFVWVCSDNITLENVILKDCPNNHAIQVTGTSNVVIRDCLFAGYNNGDIYTRETIQVEAATDGAIGGTTSKFDDKEYYHCENVVIEGCYFGKSDEFGFHQIPIGHHGHTEKSSVTGLVIRGCTFENPRIVALRLFGYSDVEVAGNKFISNQNNAVEGDGRYMIELKFSTGAVKLKNGVYLATEYSRRACENIAIHDNDFEIGALSVMGGIVATVTTGNFTFGAKAEVKLALTDFYSTPYHRFTGYLMYTNHVSNLTIYNNDIKINNGAKAEAYNSVFNLTKVDGLAIYDNEIDAPQRNLPTATLGDEEIFGAFIPGCSSIDQWQKKFVVSATSANTTAPIVLMGGETDIEAFCTASNTSAYYNFTLQCTEGGRIDRWADADGALFIEPIADGGYVFDGYYVGGARIDADTYNFSAATSVEVRFVAE